MPWKTFREHSKKSAENTHSMTKLLNPCLHFTLCKSSFSDTQLRVHPRKVRSFMIFI